MKKMILAILLVSALPAIATAEMKMQNSNPTAEPKAEPTLGHHMQNSNPNPEAEAAPVQKPEHVMQNSNPSPDPVPEHTMRNTNPKKFVSTNAQSLEEKHTEK
jgi:flagella basal body P-ring formation protein FlgA